MTFVVRDTSARGDLTEIEVTLALMRDGRRVLRPLSSASRYDLLLDNGDGTFTRVQWKTGVLRRGAVVFRLYSVSGHRGRPMPYGADVDAFGVFCRETGQAYLVPAVLIARRTTMVSLRVAATRNRQVRGVNDAEQFVIGRTTSPR